MSLAKNLKRTKLSTVAICDGVYSVFPPAMTFIQTGKSIFNPFIINQFNSL